MISRSEHYWRMFVGFWACYIIILYCKLPDIFPANWVNYPPLSWCLRLMGYYERNKWNKDEYRSSGKT